LTRDSGIGVGNPENQLGSLHTNNSSVAYASRSGTGVAQWSPQHGQQPASQFSATSPSGTTTPWLGQHYQPATTQPYTSNTSTEESRWSGQHYQPVAIQPYSSITSTGESHWRGQQLYAPDASTGNSQGPGQYSQQTAQSLRILHKS
jgi:hypothetical protein